MFSIFGDSSVFHVKNLVAGNDGGQSVRYKDDRLIFQIFMD